MDSYFSQKRLYLVSGIVVFVVLIFIAKLFYLQIIHGKQYEQLADRQYVTTTSSLFTRGSIYFTTKDGKNVSAATLKSGFKIAVNTNTMGDPAMVYEKIGGLLELERESFMKKVAGKKDPYVEIAVNVPESVAAQITPMKLPGVTAYRMNWRLYPAGDLAAQVIGFMGFKGDDFIGRYGIERSYEEVLARTGTNLYVNFFAEIFTDITKLVKNAEEVEGDIVTTLEPTVQKNLEQMVEKVKEKWGSDRVGAIVMDPKTGAIIAMGLTDTFDANQTRMVKDVSLFNNPLVESVFEMGSIMKPLIMAIALDQKVVTPTTMYTDQGFVKVGDRTIYNFDKKGRGRVSLQEVLNQSLNTGMVFVMQQMKKDAFKKQWEQFGFSGKTGIDLPGEVSGIVSNLNTNRDVEFANISFGQGTAVTPIAMIRAQAVLANGGYLVTPHVVKQIDYPSGLAKKISYPLGKQVISSETSATVTQMLIEVFDSYNQGKIKFDHYTVAAKTGTAQIANRQEGGYYTDRNLHTFMAYLPATDPQFIVFLYNYYPKNGARFSSDTLLSPFVEFAKFLISYYDIPPDR